MDWNNSRSVETKIRRLTREIRGIDEFFYGTNKDASRALYAGVIERKRDDMVRSAVLQLHTGIEDVLTSWITCRVLGIRMEEKKKRARTKSAQALRRMLWDSGSIGFDMKLNFAVAFRLINGPTQKSLRSLTGCGTNAVTTDCSKYQ